MLVVANEANSSVGERVVVSIKVVSSEGSILVLGTRVLFGEGIIKLDSEKDVAIVDSAVAEEGSKMVTVSTGISVNFEDAVCNGLDMFIAAVTVVSDFGKMRVDTGAEGLFVCRDMLVSLNPEVKWENCSESDLVVSK